MARIRLVGTEHGYQFKLSGRPLELGNQVELRIEQPGHRARWTPVRFHWDADALRVVFCGGEVWDRAPRYLAKNRDIRWPKKSRAA